MVEQEKSCARTQYNRYTYMCSVPLPTGYIILQQRCVYIQQFRKSKMLFFCRLSYNTMECCAHVYLSQYNIDRMHYTFCRIEFSIIPTYYFTLHLCEPNISARQSRYKAVPAIFIFYIEKPPRFITYIHNTPTDTL